MQKLQLAEEPTEQPQSPPEILGFEFSGFLASSEDESPNACCDILEDINLLNLSERMITSQYLSEVFHPPRFIA